MSAKLSIASVGAFTWNVVGVEYKLNDTPPAPPELVARVLGQFREAGCKAP